MSQIKDITEKFYTSISNGEIEVIDNLLSNEFELIVPMENKQISVTVTDPVFFDKENKRLNA